MLTDLIINKKHKNVLKINIFNFQIFKGVAGF